MNPQNGKNTNITNKNIQIGDLVEFKHTSNVGIGIVLDFVGVQMSTVIRHTRVYWFSLGTEDWYNNELLKQVQS